jgi:hypothetical protein
VPSVILKLMADRLAMGSSTVQEAPPKPTRREILDAYGNVMVSES